MAKIILIGGGNQVQYTIDIIEKENKYEIAGIIDSKKDINSILYGYKVLGRQENLKTILKANDIYGGIISIGDNWSRKLVSELVEKTCPNFKWINAIHPSVIIGNNVKIGHGIIAMAGTIINPGAKLGNFTNYYTNSNVEHDCFIGDFASISAGAVLGGHVKIGKLSAITLNATIFDRLEIGENTVVGSASLVTKSLPDNVIAYGNPAKIIRKLTPNNKFLK